MVQARGTKRKIGPKLALQSISSTKGYFPLRQPPHLTLVRLVLRHLLVGSYELVSLYEYEGLVRYKEVIIVETTAQNIASKIETTAQEKSRRT